MGPFVGRQRLMSLRQFTRRQGGGAAAPAQFGAGAWSIATLGTGTSARITITTLPSDGGSAITDLEYQIDGGSWVSLAGTTTGDYDLTGLTWNVEIDVAVRAVNAIGNGTASAAKAVTPLVSFAAVVALNPELAFDPVQSGSAFQERTGASATTASATNDPIGSLKNFGTKGGWLVAPSDSARPIMRASGALRYLDPDGVDDILTGSLEAFRGIAGWTMAMGVRNDGTTAATRTVLAVHNNIVGLRSATQFAITTGTTQLVTRRVDTDGVGVLNGSAHASEDIVLTTISDFTNTDAFTRVDAVQEATNASWMSSGNTDSTGGVVSLCAYFGSSTPSSFFDGPISCAFAFPAALTGGNLTLVERYVAQTKGLSL